MLQQQQGDGCASAHDCKMQWGAADGHRHPSIKHAVVCSADVSARSKQRHDNAGAAAPDCVVQGSEPAQVALVDKPAEQNPHMSSRRSDT